MSATRSASQLPDEGAIVVTTKREGIGSDACIAVAVDVCKGVKGLFHISAIASGWLHHIRRYFRLKQVLVLKIIRVKRARTEADSSFKQISSKGPKPTLIEVKKIDNFDAIMEFIKCKLRLADPHVEKTGEKVLLKFDFVFVIFEDIARMSRDSLQRLDFSEYMKKGTDEGGIKIQVPHVDVMVLKEMFSKSDAIGIKKTMIAVIEGIKENAKILDTHVGAPRYPILVTVESFMSAQTSMNGAVANIFSANEKQHTAMNSVREESNTH